MKTIRLAYANMWGRVEAFNAAYMYKMFPYLAPHYTFVLDSSYPQLAFYSAYGYVAEAHRYPDAVRVLYVGEPGQHFAQGAKLAPGVNEPGFYHYALTMDRAETHPNHTYMPLCALMIPLHFGVGLEVLVRPEGWKTPVKTRFCDFIYSNGQSQRRIDFFHLLSHYRHVDSAGAVERNTDALAGTGYDSRGYAAKQRFQAASKFSLAFENTQFKGYNSEKASDPLCANSVPIYWGDPCIKDLFNPDAMINVDDFVSDADAVAYIREVDQDDALYRSCAMAPPFRDNVVPGAISDATFLAFWHRVLGDL